MQMFENEINWNFWTVGSHKKCIWLIVIGSLALARRLIETQLVSLWLKDIIPLSMFLEKYYWEILFIYLFIYFLDNF